MTGSRVCFDKADVSIERTSAFFLGGKLNIISELDTGETKLSAIVTVERRYTASSRPNLQNASEDFSSIYSDMIGEYISGSFLP